MSDVPTELELIKDMLTEHMDYMNELAKRILTLSDYVLEITKKVQALEKLEVGYTLQGGN